MSFATLLVHNGYVRVACSLDARDIFTASAWKNNFTKVDGDFASIADALTGAGYSLKRVKPAYVDQSKDVETQIMYHYEKSRRSK